MAKVHSTQTLRARGWSQRRIARKRCVDRETVARHTPRHKGKVEPGVEHLQDNALKPAFPQ
jgi:hypothetical protein